MAIPSWRRNDPLARMPTVRRRSLRREAVGRRRIGAMSSPTEIKLRMAEIYTLDLEADTDQHLQLLKQLQDDLALKHAIGRGAYSVARKRFDAATQATEALLRQISAHRELLNDLRTTLSELRKTVSGELRTTAARRTPHQEN